MKLTAFLSQAAVTLQTRRVLLAPVCLCLVAGLHLWRVSTAGQTPWKGGSFGMFSTIDSESARFVRAELLTVDGPRAIAIPSDLDKMIAELRAAPSQEQLQRIASRLADLVWVNPLAEQQRLAERLKQLTGQPVGVEQLQALRSSAAANSPSATVAGLVAAKNQQSSVEPEPVAFTAVRIDLYKFEMPTGTVTLQPRRLLTATADRRQGQP